MDEMAKDIAANARPVGSLLNRVQELEKSVLEAHVRLSHVTERLNKAESVIGIARDVDRPSNPRAFDGGSTGYNA